VTDYANANIKSWISDKAVVEAIKAQNAENASLAQGDIDALDQKWRAGVDGGDTAIIDEVLAIRCPASCATSRWLRTASSPKSSSPTTRASMSASRM
jgi:hypothetical protein